MSVAAAVWHGSFRASPPLSTAQIDVDRISFGRFRLRSASAPIGVTITNRSEREVVIHSLSMGCGCMKAVATLPQTLRPHGSMTASVTLDPNRMQLDAHSYELLAIDDSGSVVAKERFSYEFDPVLIAPSGPVTLWFDTDAAAFRGKIVCDTTLPEGTRFAVRSDSEEVAVNLADMVGQGRFRTFDVVLTAPASFAGRSCEIVIASPADPNAIATVRVVAEALVQGIDRPDVFFGTLYCGDTVTRQLTMRQVVEKGSTVSPVALKSDTDAIVIIPNEGGFLLKFTPSKAGVFSGKLTMQAPGQESDVIWSANVLEAKKASQ
jgi:hypothetical protein